ncbi:MAG TPA: hypothetical protein VMZ71_17540 [Gemmataceae bacterium]|nr:hypothetical protein [Gemmataceae bacterium]
MVPLRTTPRLPVWPRAAALGVCALLAAVVGCGSESRPPHVPARALMPAPDAERIVYDARERALVFYDLPNSARWVVQLPGSEKGANVGPVHRLPDGIDPEQTLVFYTRPNGKASNAVSLRQILDARDTHASSMR